MYKYSSEKRNYKSCKARLGGTGSRRLTLICESKVTHVTLVHDVVLDLASEFVVAARWRHDVIIATLLVRLHVAEILFDVAVGGENHLG